MLTQLKGMVRIGLEKSEAKSFLVFRFPQRSVLLGFALDTNEALRLEFWLPLPFALCLSIKRVGKLPPLKKWQFLLERIGSTGYCTSRLVSHSIVHGRTTNINKTFKQIRIDHKEKPLIIVWVLFT